MFAIPGAIVKKGQKIILHLELFVVLAYDVVHVDVRELKVYAFL